MTPHEKLRARRIELGYSQEELRNIAGLSKTSYWYLENGQRDLRKTQAWTVYKLAQALGVPMEYFFVDYDNV